MTSLAENPQTELHPSLATTQPSRPVASTRIHVRAVNVPLVATILAYIAATIWMLYAGGGTPFVLDGNESFSAHLHAQNLLTYGFSYAKGLTDEAAGGSPLAHPYIYTHGGNFPRLFSLLLLAVGIKPIEWHIALAALLIGTLAMFMCFRLFESLANRAIALLVSLVFITNYILGLEWQVNSYRVWHTFFFFAPLYCVQTAHRRPKWRTFAYLALDSICVGYFDVTFAIFAVVSTCVFVLIKYRAQARSMFYTFLAQFVGLGAAAVVIVGQELWYLGLSDTLEDIRLTYFVRNFATSLSADELHNTVLQFFASRHILFWDNRSTHEVSYFTVPAIAQHVGQTVLSVYTPLLLFVVFVLAAALALVGLGRSLRAQPVVVLRRFVDTGVPTPVRSCVNFALLFAGLYTIQQLTVPELSVQMDALTQHGLVHYLAVGFAREFVAWTGPLQLLVALLCSMFVAWYGTGHALRFGGLKTTRVLAAAALVASTAFYLLNNGDIYNRSNVSIWMWYMQDWWPNWLQQAVLNGTVLVAVSLIVGSRTSARASLSELRLRAAGLVVAAGAAGFISVYTVLPGYVDSLYLQQLHPMLIFSIDPVIGIVVYVLGSLGLSELRRLVHVIRRRFGANVDSTRPDFAAALMSVGSLCLAALLCAYWGRMQVGYAELLPPDALQPVKALAAAPFAGSTFVSDSYGPVISYFTGQWAYSDYFLPQHVVRSKNGSARVLASAKYLWYADRDTNPDYLTPDYYFCFKVPNLSIAARMILLSPGERDRFCSLEPLFLDASATQPTALQDTIVDHDASPADAWAAIKLNKAVPLLPTEVSAAGQLGALYPSPTALPDIPDVYVTVNDLFVDVRWRNLDDNAWFVVERSDGDTDANGSFYRIGATEPGGLNLNDTGTKASTTYSWRVQACNPNGCSAFSEPVSATTHSMPPATVPPGVPSSLAANVVAPNKIILFWQNTGAGRTDAVDVERSEPGQDFRVISTTGREGSSFDNTSLVPNTTYTWRVRACNDAGCSAYSRELSARTPPVPASSTLPHAPVLFAPQLVSDSEATLYWKNLDALAVTDHLERKDSADGVFQEIDVSDVGLTSQDSIDLKPSTTYWWRVRACNGAGCSDYSNEVSTTTPTAMPLVVAPAAPPEPAAAPAPVLAPVPQPVQDAAAGESEAAPVDETAQLYTVAGTGALGLRIHSDASSSSPVIGTVPDGSRLRVETSDATGAYYRVQGDGFVGYAAAEYLSNPVAGGSAPPQPLGSLR